MSLRLRHAASTPMRITCVCEHAASKGRQKLGATASYGRTE